MRPVVKLTLIAGGVLLLAARQQGGQIDAADGDVTGGFSVDALTDNLQSYFYQLTDQGTNVDPNTAAANLSAFLAMIRQSEGADYSTCYGYSHTIQDFSDHPAVTGEWTGVVLPDAMCANAGYSPGCKSTAAGGYQIRKPTWVTVRDKLGLTDFSAASQDQAAIQLISDRGALGAVQSGDLQTAITRCRNEWASLPGNSYGQGGRSLDQLTAWYQTSGGTLA